MPDYTEPRDWDDAALEELTGERGTRSLRFWPGTSFSGDLSILARLRVLIQVAVYGCDLSEEHLRAGAHHPAGAAGS